MSWTVPTFMQPMVTRPQYGDTVTNIIVVQFSENVQTMMDKRYNLTCTTIGPSDSVVTSGYIGAGYGTNVAGATRYQSMLKAVSTLENGTRWRLRPYAQLRSENFRTSDWSSCARANLD